MTTRTTKTTIFTRRVLIAAVAMGVIALAAGYFVHPMPVGATSQVDNHQLDSGPISSVGFTEDPGVCDAGGFAGGVTWHFVLNKYDSGDADIFGSFQSAGPFGPIHSSSRNGPVLMFYVNTATDDTLLTNWAILDTADDNAQLQLSSVCHGGTTQQSAAASVPASAEQSVKAGTGTPAASTSNTALFENGSSPLPTIAFSLILLASLGTLAYANVKSVRS